jgi:hypothetical protein
MPIVDGEVVVDPETGTRGFVYAVPMFPGGKQAFKCAVHMIGELMHTEDFHVRPGSSPAGFDLCSVANLNPTSWTRISRK